MRPLLGRDPREEAAAQTQLISHLAARGEAEIAREIERATIALARGFERTGEVPPLPDDSLAALEAVMRGMAERTVAAFGIRVFDAVKASGPHETKSFAEFFQRLALEFIAAEMIRRRIIDIDRTTRQQVVNAVEIGQRDGFSVDKIGASIRARAPQMSRLRSHVIARTETQSAANYGAHNAAVATGIQLMKQWVAVEDHRTRDFLEPTISMFSHRDVDGQLQPLDQPFQVPTKLGTTEALQYPGDPAGSPGNTIMCRCASVHQLLE